MKKFPAKIIYAEDEADIQELVVECFSSYDHVTLKVCSNGQDLVDSMKDFEPDLILLDLSMPGVDGIDAIEEFYKGDKLKAIPIIFITGHRDVKMEQAYKNINVIGIIHKPFSPGMLPERIRFMWTEYHKKSALLQKIKASEELVE